MTGSCYEYELLTLIISSSNNLIMRLSVDTDPLVVLHDEP